MQDLKKLQAELGYEFKEPKLLMRALTHRSFLHEKSQKGKEDNETLEFLGDAVLDLVLGHLLMTTFPDDLEGDLSKKRANLVNEVVLAQKAQQIGLADYIRLGKGEIRSGGAQKPRLLCSALEAVMGAIFLDGGYSASARFVEGLFADRIADVEDLNNFNVDYKSRFQELVQQKRKVTPTYRVISESGPDHDKTFEVEVLVQEQVITQGEGKSKKQAEQRAAELALEHFE